MEIDHHSSEHDDRVVSLAMAALKAMDLPAEAADPHAGIVTEDAELVEQIELKYQEWGRLSAPWGIPPT
jgi:hypothetical protein